MISTSVFGIGLINPSYYASLAIVADKKKQASGRAVVLVVKSALKKPFEKGTWCIRKNT